MINALYGMLGAILAFLLFASGIYVGYKLHATKVEHETPKQPTPIQLEEAERRRLIEDQKAFRTQMGYNAEMAYGFTAGEDGEV